MKQDRRAGRRWGRLVFRINKIGRAQFGKTVVFLLLAILAPRHGSAQSADLQKVLAEMNTAAQGFQRAQADFSWDQLQAVVDEHDVQTGTIYFDRKSGGGSTQMAAYIKQMNGQDAPKTVVYNGAELQFYQPSIKQLTIFSAGANRGQYESFLTLGFGGSGTDLQANWDVTFSGMETMDGVQVAKLDLKPKAENVRQMFTHVTIWVEPAKGISHKQVFSEPSGDMRTATYTNIKYNAPLSPDVFRIKTLPGTTTVRK